MSPALSFGGCWAHWPEPRLCLVPPSTISMGPSTLFKEISPDCGTSQDPSSLTSVGTPGGGIYRRALLWDQAGAALRGLLLECEPRRGLLPFLGLPACLLLCGLPWEGGLHIVSHPHMSLIVGSAFVKVDLTV